MQVCRRGMHFKLEVLNPIKCANLGFLDYLDLVMIKKNPSKLEESKINWGGGEVLVMF